MNKLFEDSLYAGVTLSLFAYMTGEWISKKLKLRILNPLLISIIITIALLLVCDIEYEAYNQSAEALSFLLTPATVCFAIPLYEQWELLKNNIKAVMAGILSGVLTSLTTVLIIAKLMEFTHEEYVTMLPKSITTAIGISVSKELGGYVNITVAVIVVTGVLGNMFGEELCRLFKIDEPISKGLSLGTSSHAVGTARAIKMGETEGAMSALAVAAAGFMTVILADFFAGFL